MSPRPSKRTTDKSRKSADLVLDVHRLKEAMDRRGMNYARLADETGLTRSALSYFKSGDRQPSRSVLAELADKLSVTVDYLLGVSDGSNVEGLLKNPRIKRLVELYAELTTADQERVLEIIQQMRGDGPSPQAEGSAEIDSADGEAADVEP